MKRAIHTHTCVDAEETVVIVDVADREFDIDFYHKIYTYMIYIEQEQTS